VGVTDGTRVSVLPEVDLRPQSVLLTLFGDYLSDGDDVVSAGSLIELLDSAGVGSYATRATLTRMVKRGLLRRVTSGRRAYFGLTEFGRRTVLDGRARAQDSDVVDRRWDGSWTFVSFSLPDGSQQARHLLRSRLTWAGFGMVQGGLWAAPREIDVVALLSDLDLLAHVNAFRGEPLAPTETARLVDQSYDLAAVAESYAGFLDRWLPLKDKAVDKVGDPLTARVLLATDWLLVLRDDPRLPVQLLPQQWPGLPAIDLQRSLDRRLRRPAEREAARRLEVLTKRAEA
jgi:phenylacetic acid degradation operon negative regulatory protein